MAEDKKFAPAWLKDIMVTAPGQKPEVKDGKKTGRMITFGETRPACAGDVLSWKVKDTDKGQVAVLVMVDGNRHEIPLTPAK